MTDPARDPTASTLSRGVDAPVEGARRGGASLATLVRHLEAAVVRVAGAARRAPLEGGAEATGGENPSGDAQIALDVSANRIFVDVFEPSRLVAAIVSEELDEIRVTRCDAGSRYILCVDPLDGSANTAVNGCTGSVFALYVRSEAGVPCRDLEAELLGGARTALCGYALYGPATLLVLAVGDRVDGFALDPETGRFVRSHPGMTCPRRGGTYSVNTGNSHRWEAGVRDFIRHLDEDDAPGRPYALRYSGALVADLHRTLVEGGIYLYPADEVHPQGKMRLLYEAIPLAVVVETAGGAASTGHGRLLEVERRGLHQTTPVALGSKDDVAAFERFLGAADAG